jgi:kinetochore protein NDC80
MTTSIRALVDFLLQHNFNNEFPSTSISPKVLAKPTNKDFQNVVLFLFKQLDPNYKCTGKFEDEMITMFKFLGYPFQIAKSSISAVGSPHAWPSLLAAIMWLVELLQYDIAVQQSNYSMFSAEGSFSGGDNGFYDSDDPAVSERAFYRYLGKAYELFLAGKDDQYVKLEEQFISSFENRNVLIRDQIDSYEKRNHALTQEIEAVKGRSAYLPELEAKKKEFQTDHQKFVQLLDELKKHRDQLKQKVELRAAELEKCRATHERAVREVAVLKERVDTQELSAADVANMVNERKRLEEAQAAASESRQALQRRCCELEMALRDKVQYLEDAVRAYHTVAGDLQLVPATARNARGENLGIELDIGAKKREGLIKTDIRRGVLPVLQELKKELVETTLALRSDLLAEQDLLDEIDCKRTELLGAKEMMEAKLKRAEAAYKREKDLLDQGTEINRQVSAN